LAALYGSPLGERLVFKGGTSLSKAYKVIRRFSEDVDLTYDIRAIAPDLVGLLLEDAEPFQALMARCADIMTRANHKPNCQPDRGPPIGSL
jgi:hypothetical protein